ncbi:hypothetical protein [Agromyces soli]|uniref:SH3 domain-containing protein n=1 Tax=Agromyces soli TaxID=659012 RepID=A0ABY4AXR9_9MICO|nr:hypothetical protein [Agromyces soli]UOE27649.1 hypothetical protein MTP13_07690 [Agromyces soli]
MEHQNQATATDTRLTSKRRGTPLRRARLGAAAASAAAALLLTAVAPAPAHAVGMKSVTGVIECRSWPAIWVGTSATARGDVKFQLNRKDNLGTIGTVYLGKSSTYAPWGYKWITSGAGNFYAYGLTASGNVTKAARYCQA